MSLLHQNISWNDVGLWRSLVARLHGAQEVVGSNPASPTKPDSPQRSESFFLARSIDSAMAIEA